MIEVRRRLLMDGRNVPTGKGTRIALLDTGVDQDHPDPANCLDLSRSRGFTIVDGFIDKDGQGTHLAGIIAGSGKESNGQYRGLAPDSQLLIYKCSLRGSGYESDAEEPVAAAIQAKVDIINFSQMLTSPR